MSKLWFPELCTTVHQLSDTPQRSKHWPAKLLYGADINDSVMKVVHKLWHVLVQEPLVCMYRVTCKNRNYKTSLQKPEKLNNITVLLLQVTHQQGDIVQAGCAV